MFLIHRRDTENATFLFEQGNNMQLNDCMANEHYDKMLSNTYFNDKGPSLSEYTLLTMWMVDVQ